MGKPGIMVYFTSAPAIRSFPDEECGKLFKAMLDYGEHQTEPDFSGSLAGAWMFLKPALDMDDRRYEEITKRCSEASKKRWAGNRKKHADDACACGGIEMNAAYANTIHYNTNNTASKPEGCRVSDADLVEYPEESGSYRPFWEVPKDVIDSLSAKRRREIEGRRAELAGRAGNG